MVTGRRIDHRTVLDQRVLFSRGVKRFPGKCKNISRSGALIHTRYKLKMAPGLELRIGFASTNHQTGIERKAIVKWVDNNRFGVQFNRRRNDRKKYRNEVSVYTNSNILPAMINDLSIGGANMLCKNKSNKFLLKEGVEIHVTIPFAIQQDYLSRKAIIKWVVDDHFGIEFI